MNIYELTKEKFILPHADRDWAAYRTKVTNQLLKQTCHISAPSLAILGAGHCNDIDLNACASQFDTISLIDEDADAMQDAVNRVTADLRQRIQITPATLSGLTPEHINTMCNSIMDYVRIQGTSLSYPDYIDYVTEHVKQLSDGLYQTTDELSSILPKNSYDMIVCLGLHSQLLTMPAYCLETIHYNICRQLYGMESSDLTPFYPILTHMIESLIPLINQTMLEATAKYLFLGCEYSEQSPIIGACHSIADIRERIKINTNLELTEQHIEWAFNPEQHICYDILLQMISKH